MISVECFFFWFFFLFSICCKIQFLSFQLQREALVSCLPHIIRYLSAESPVVHTYAAHTIERLLTIKTSQNTAM